MECISTFSLLKLCISNEDLENDIVQSINNISMFEEGEESFVKYRCPFCNTIHSGIEWDSVTLIQLADDKINDFSDNDIESIEMHIPGYHYVCPNCGGEADIGNIETVKTSPNTK